MKETLTERMRHAAAHVELYDQQWEAEQLRDGAKALDKLREWMRETDWLHFVGDHPEAADWFPND